MVQTRSVNGPQHLSNYAHPYLPPGIALDIDLGGLISPFLFFFLIFFIKNNAN